MDMSLSKLREMVKDRKPGMLQFMGSQRVRHNLATTIIKRNESELLIETWVDLETVIQSGKVKERKTNIVY